MMGFFKKANWYQNNLKKDVYFISIFAVEFTQIEIQYKWQDELLDKCTVITMGLQLTSNLRVLLVLSPTGLWMLWVQLEQKRYFKNKKIHKGIKKM